MACEAEEAEVAAIRALLNEKLEPGQKPVGRALLWAELQRAETALRKCRGAPYDIDFVLFDLSGTVSTAGIVARQTGVAPTATLSGSTFHFNSTPASSAGLITETATGQLLSRSGSPLPGTSSGRSELTVLVPRPTQFSKEEVAAFVPSSGVLGGATLPIPTPLGLLTVKVTVTSVVVALAVGGVSITVSGAFVTGPSLAQAATTLFTHTAAYRLEPCRSVLRLDQCVLISAPTVGTLTLTPTAGWAFFRPLGSTILWLAQRSIEEVIREQVRTTLEDTINARVTQETARALAQSPVPLQGRPVVTLRALTILPSGLSFAPSVSVHV